MCCLSIKILKTKTQQQKTISATQRKAKIVFSTYKKMHMYCKNCKKHMGNTFPEKLVLISKNKIKGKSKCAIC